MSAIRAIASWVSLPAPAVAAGALRAATGKARDTAQCKMRLAEWILATAIERGCDASPVVDWLLARHAAGDLDPALVDLMSQVGRRKQAASRATMLRDVAKARDGGLRALVPRHQGSQAKVHEWEARAHYWLRSESYIVPGHICKILQQEGFAVEYHQVLRWHNRLPATMRNNRQRLGDLKFDSTQRPFVRRHTREVPVGACYQSDGNKMPVYLKHPTGLRPHRYELTPLIDVRSRYLVGRWLSDSESGVNTIHALTDGILRHGHVPLEVQADNGPGFKNQLVKRYYEKLSIAERHSRARNPKDNGYVERFHQTMKDEFLKQLPGYCGRDRSREGLQRYLKAAERGELSLMTAEDFLERLDRYTHWYNHERVHGETECTPASLWAQLSHRPPVDLEHAFFWDQAERVVHKCAIEFRNREYMNREILEAYNNTTVIVEYNLHDDAFIRVLDKDERWICEAKLIKAAPYRSTSVIQDHHQKAARDSLGRIEKKKQETQRRAGLEITHDQTLDGLEQALFGNQRKVLEPSWAAATAQEDEASSITLDLTKLDY